MRRVRKIAIVVSVVTLTVILLVYFGQFAYLRTDSAKELAAAKIGEILGGNVKVTELSGGVGSTDLHLEIPGNPGEKSVVSGKVRVDVSPLGLAIGTEPKVIHIDGPTVNLRLDKDNNILDKLPQSGAGGGGGAIPNVVITGAKVNFTQEGKPDFNVSGADITITTSGTKISVNGKIKDELYGAWTITGEVDRSNSLGSVTLRTDAPIHLTPAKLKAVPYVPNETWEAVELDGQSSVDVRIGRDAEAKWSWKIECSPTGTLLKVFPIDLVTTDTSAGVLIEGARVTLKNVRGKTADGTVQSNAVLDFEKKPSRLSFQVTATDLDVKKTPAKWGLAGRVDQGRLNGNADITLVIAEGSVKPEGTGRATILGKFAGGQAEVEVHLTGDGEKLKFVDMPATKSRRIQPTELFALAVGVVLQPPAIAPKLEENKKEPEYVQANIKLKDVDIAELIQRGNIQSPVKLAGKVSLEITAELPTDNLGGLKYYRATGKVSSPSLQIEGLMLKNVSAEIKLKDGVLTLNHLSASFEPGTDGKVGMFNGSAKFGIEPRTELTAQLMLQTIPLEQVFAAIPGLGGKAEGKLSGHFDLMMPGDKLGDMTALVANGNLTSDGLKLFDQQIDKLAIEVAVKDGIAKLAKAEVEVYKGKITGDAKLPLTGKKDGTFLVQFQDVDANMMTRAIPNSPVKLSGKLIGKLDGTAPPLDQFDATKVVANLVINSPRLVVQGIPTSKLTGKIAYKPGVIAYDLQGSALGGSFDVEGTYPLGEKMGPLPPEKPAGGTIRLQRLNLDQLGRDLDIKALENLRGELTLSLRYTHPDNGIFGNGRLEIRDFGWGDEFTGTSNVVSEITMNPYGFEIPTINGDLAGGRLRGRLKYSFDNQRTSFLSLTLDNAESSSLLQPLGFKSGSGRISATLRTGLGKEFRGGGMITATRTTISGIEVDDLRVPYIFAKVPGGGFQLTMRDVRGNVATGRVTGRVEIVAHEAAAVEGRIEFVDVNISNLAKSFGASSYGLGKTTGRFDFNGNSVRTSSDLKGTLTATVGNANVREFPILGTITPLMSPIQSLTTYDSGDLIARLGNGQFRVEQLALTGKSTKLFADGTVGLNGTLDLNVVYNTGQIGPSAPVLRLIARNIPFVGPIPVGLIVRATEALANRVIRLRLTGTVDRPSASVSLAGLLTENAVRFFVGQYVPLGAAK